jgi:hypothetical protein
MLTSDLLGATGLWAGLRRILFDADALHTRA